MIFHKGFGFLGVAVVLSIPMVAFSAQRSLAIPLEPILDRVGRSMVEGLFGIGAGAQGYPANQQFIYTQDPAGSPGAYPPTSSPPASTSPAPAYPGYQSPAYPPASYPPAYPGYQSPAYPPASYPPAYPGYQSPAYPPPATAYPAYQSPAYPAYPPPYPAYPPPRSGTPVIINNF
jgi:hypothetical protein